MREVMGTMGSSLIRGRYVVCKVTDKNTSQIIDDGAVFQRDGEIIEVGPYAELKSRHISDEEIGSSDFVVIPGLVNAHHHYGVTTFQLGAPDAPLEVWITSRMATIDVDPYLDTLYCAMQMLESGITTVMHNHNIARTPVGTGVYEASTQIIEAYEEAGMRVAFSLAYRDQNRLVYEDDERFLGTLPLSLAQETQKQLGAAPLSMGDYLSICAELHQQKQSSNTNIFISPQNVQWCSDTMLNEARAFATRYSTGIHMHLQETVYQKIYGKRHWGKTPLSHLYDLGFLGPDVSCAHGVWLSESDMDILAETDTMICHQPGCNLRINSGIAPLNTMLEKGVTVAIGTDSVGLNDDNDLFQEMRLAQKLHRVPGVTSSYPTSHQILRMATSNGARATFFGDQVGTLEVGKRADLALIDLGRITEPYLHPDTNIVDALVYRGKGLDVDTVMVEGKVLLQNRKFTTLNKEDIISQLKKSLDGPISPNIARRAELGRRLLPYIRDFYEAWPIGQGAPHYLYNERD